METVVEKIYAAQAEAMARGILNIWTVYDHPADFPHSYVARRFEAGPLGSHPTADIVEGELLAIRECFESCGLTCLARTPDDEPQIVECWL